MSEHVRRDVIPHVDIEAGYQHEGASYLEILALLHGQLRPKTYFEIGTSGGASLRLSKCRSAAVDPNFQLTLDVVGEKPAAMLFQTSSDNFFANEHLDVLLGGNVGLAFLDGLHLFEFLLRDFINTEKYCGQNSVIALHDCLPIDHYMTARPPIPASENPSPYKEAWTGDVWKILPVLKKFRPALKIICLNAPPTGLVLCTCLQPSSTTLAEAYFDIVEEWSKVTLENFGVERLLRDSEIVHTNSIASFYDIASHFWL